MLIATLINWNDADRRKGNAWIRIHDAYSNQGDKTVTVAIGQNPRAALAAAGYKVTSGTRKNHQGQVQFTVSEELPGLRAAQASVGSLIVRAGL